MHIQFGKWFVIESRVWSLYEKLGRREAFLQRGFSTFN